MLPPVSRDAAGTRLDGWRNLLALPVGHGHGDRLLECDDFESARRAMEQTEVNAHWQAEMGEFFVGLEGRRPDKGLLRLDEIFHLD
jgi:L-rhamnose mutarotase